MFARLRSSLWLLLPLLGCSSEPASSAAGKPHVIVISLDTTRADHLGAYGSKTRTPNLDVIAEEGVVLDDLSTAATTTLASHTTLFTGTHPRTHGVPRNGFHVNEANEMLAELLRDQGYRTAAILGSYALEPLFGIDQGFQYVDDEFDIALAQGNIFDQSQRTADHVTAAALRWLSTVGDEPVFLFVHYFDAHQPYTPPAPYDRMYWGGDPPELPEFPEATSRRKHQRLGSGTLRSMDELLLQGLAREQLTERHVDPDDIDLYLASQYAGEVSFVDEQVGLLLDDLRARGLYDDAVILVVSDHGETFWEHGDQWNHGLAAYQTTVHVPGLLRLPHGAAAGARVGAAVSSIDLLPTVLDFLDVPTPERVEGASLRPLIEGTSTTWDRVFGEATQPRSEAIERDGWYNDRKPHFVRLNT